MPQINFLPFPIVPASNPDYQSILLSSVLYVKRKDFYQDPLNVLDMERMADMKPRYGWQQPLWRSVLLHSNLASLNRYYR